jgi:hypothetical protein
LDKEARPGHDRAMLSRPGPIAANRRRGAGTRGLAVLAVLVVVGLGSGAGFYRWQRARQAERFERDLAAAPQGPEERLDLWLKLAGPQLHHRLAVVGRFTSEQPWLVTHAQGVAGEVPEFFGVTCAELQPTFARRSGLEVVVALPAPHALGRVDLAGERAQRVPTFAPEVVVDAPGRLAALALYLLEDMPAALERDIPGARIVLEVAGERVPR